MDKKGYYNIEIDTKDLLNQVFTKDLITEMERRGFSVSHNNEDKETDKLAREDVADCLTTEKKDKTIKKAVNMFLDDDFKEIDKELEALITKKVSVELIYALKWDWKEQPNFNLIVYSISEITAKGKTPYIYKVETRCDDYGIIISSIKGMSDSEVYSIWEQKAYEG